MKIAITGHRPNKLGNDYNLTSPLVQKIKERIIHEVMLYYSDDLTLISGMALGVDTLFAQIAIGCLIPFIAAIPCINQDKMWIDKSKALYHKILQKASSIKLVGEAGYCTYEWLNEAKTPVYNSDCMQNRNIWMVDNCDILIAVWDGTSGGTANCVKYAQSKNKEIIFINPKEITV